MRHRGGWWRHGARLAVLATLMAVLSGCWGIAPIEKSGLVGLLGIDAGQNGGFVITAVVLAPEGGPPTTQGARGSASSTALIRQASGDTVFAALRNLSTVSQLDLGFSHLQGLVVSEPVARAGLADTLDALLRSPEVAEVAPWLLVARGTSAAAVLTETKDAVPDAGAALTNTVKWAWERTPLQAMRVWNFLKQVPIDGDAPVTAGLIAATDQGSGDSAAFGISGLALFRGGTLVGWLDGPAALGWGVVAGQVREEALVVPAGEQGSFTLELHAVRRSIRVVPGPGGPSVQLKVRVSAQLADVEGPAEDLVAGPRIEAEIEAAGARVLTADVEAAVAEAQADGADVLGLGERVRLQNFSAWTRLGGDWPTGGFPQLPVTSSVTVHLADVGDTFCQLLGPC